MRIIYTETALCDLANIYEYQALNWQSVTLRFNMRLVAIERYISDYPRGAPKPSRRGNVRAIGFDSFPHRLFYQANADTNRSAHNQTHIAGLLARVALK
jgi:plasmid stabilization system protein ParE